MDAPHPTAPSQVADTGRVDAVVVGAGPAGACAAYALARARPDARILLIERAQAPGPRPCGEFLKPAGWAVLERLGLAADAAAVTAPLAGLDLVAADGCLRTDFAVPARGLRRERFDAMLQAAAGRHARLLRARVAAFAHDGASWSLQLVDPAGDRQTVTTPLLIAADGRFSRARRAAGLPLPPRRDRAALATRATGFAHRGRCEMHLGPFGQVGMAPADDGSVNLNLLLAPPCRTLLTRWDRERLLRSALIATPSLADRARGLRCGPVMSTGRLPAAGTTVVGPDLVLVGDAASFCDPFTGEGISMALESGELAAQCLAPALGGASGPRRAAIAAYARDWRRIFRPRLRLSACCQAILQRRALGERCVALLGRVEPACRLSGTIAAGWRL